MQSKKNEKGLASSKQSEAGPVSTSASQGGQVFLIVVLVMVIGLTVGLSVASRSVTNLKTSLEEENSQRAFAAAEAGIEKALKSGVSSGETQFGELNTKIKSVSVNSVNGSSIRLQGDALIDKNDGVDIWFSDNISQPLQGATWTGKMNIYWGDEDTCAADTTAGIEVIVFSKVPAPANVASQRYVYNPCQVQRPTGDVIAPGAGKTFSGSPAREYKFSTGDIDVAEGYIARVIPLYAATHIGVEHVDTTGSWPDQGKIINSTGTAGGTTRKITYYQGWPKIPNEIFQYILFQPN